MPSDPTSKALIDIRHNITLATGWARPLSVVEFANDLLVFYATTRALEIISEASRRLPEDLLARHPDIPWRSMRDAGNFYRHEYDRVLEEFVWSAATNSLPVLLKAVEAELARGDRRSQDLP